MERTPSEVSRSVIQISVQFYLDHFMNSSLFKQEHHLPEHYIPEQNVNPPPLPNKEY